MLHSWRSATRFALPAAHLRVCGTYRREGRALRLSPPLSPPMLPALPLREIDGVQVVAAQAVEAAVEEQRRAVGAQGGAA